jgi:hypothetical protein
MEEKYSLMIDKMVTFFNGGPNFDWSNDYLRVYELRTHLPIMGKWVFDLINYDLLPDVVHRVLQERQFLQWLA